MSITPVKDDDKRFYPITAVDGRTQDDGSPLVEMFASVTTIINPLSSTGLIGWAGWLAAKHAILMLPKLVASMLVRQCGRTYFKHDHQFGERCTDSCPCGRCTPCLQDKLADMHIAEKHRRSNEGTAVHDWIEEYVMSVGATRLPMPDHLAGYVTQFERFVVDYGLTHDDFLFSEVTAVNREHKYAGRLDGGIMLHAERTPLAAYVVAAVRRTTVADAIERKLTAVVLVDYKSKEKESFTPEGKPDKVKLYPSQAMQLTAYRECPEVMFKGTDVFTQMPETHGAMVIQLRPTSYTVRVVDTGPETFAAFLAAEDLFYWLHFSGSQSVSSTRNAATKPLPARPVRKRAAPKAAAVPVEPPVPAAPTPAKAAKATKAAAPRKTAGRPNRTMESLRRPVFAGGPANAHPDSPMGDEIPF